MRYNDLITPEGTKDYLFEESAIKNNIRCDLHKLFKSMGYSEIMTPGIEFYDVFDQNSHYFPQDKMLKFTDSKNRLVVLRPDSTIPIARVTATRLKNTALPLRLFYNQSVFRHVQGLKGKSVEVEQMGIEMMGVSSKLADLEVLSAAAEALSCCCDDFNIEIGHASIYNELISLLEINDNHKEMIRSLIESKNYPMLNDYLSQFGNNKIIEILKELPELFGGREVFEKARKVIKNIAKITYIIDELEETYDNLLSIIPEEKLSVDLSMAHKTDYYTGIMVKGYLNGYGKEVLSGGRYDKLLAEFDYDIPAMGFAINIDAIAKVKYKNKEYTSDKPDMIVHAEEGYELKALQIAKDYRKKGKTVEISLFDDKDILLDYSKEKGISAILVVNENIEIND